jgi:hypothetical protein
VVSATVPEMLPVPDDACPNTAELLERKMMSVKHRLTEAHRSLNKPEPPLSNRIIFDYLPDVVSRPSTPAARFKEGRFKSLGYQNLVLPG